PTPFERGRRRRRVRAVIAALLLAGAVPLALVLVERQDDPGPAEASGPGPTPEAPGAPDAEREPDALVRPDLDGLGPSDLALARVLIEIDRSERTMLAYDLELTEAFGGPGADEGGQGGGMGEVPDLEAVLAAAAAAAARGEAALVDSAGRLAAGAGAPGAEAVREAYVPHLEAWRAHLARVAATPDVLLTEGGTESDTAEINVTADAFRRALEVVLEGTVDAEVAAFAEAILDRGFRGYERDAEVVSPSPRASARSAASSATSASMRSSS
ncbi:MAG: hypothetical protein RLZZ272_862, partial [Actinomycetota bacterium]